MRIKVSHRSAFTYEPPARSIAQVLRLTPRSFEGQYVLRWRITTDIDSVLRQTEDSLGNIVHSFSHSGPLVQIEVAAEGEVETFDAVGVIRGSVEPLPPELYLRAAPLAVANAALRQFAEDSVGGKREPLDRLHPVMGAIHDAIAFDPAPAVAPTSAADAFASRRGGAQEFAHIFIACSRWLGTPARYVSGYLVGPDAGSPNGAHAWAESYVPDLGWVAFDAVHDKCADENYVRMAVGFDYQSAAPVRSARVGFGSETKTEAVWIGRSQKQTQNQGQSQV